MKLLPISPTPMLNFLGGSYSLLQLLCVSTMAFGFISHPPIDLGFCFLGDMLEIDLRKIFLTSSSYSYRCLPWPLRLQFLFSFLGLLVGFFFFFPCGKWLDLGRVSAVAIFSLLSQYYQENFHRIPFDFFSHWIGGIPGKKSLKVDGNPM